jgi:hypothetical protein
MLAEGYFRLCRELADALWEHNAGGRSNVDPVTAWIGSFNSATGLPIKWESHSRAKRGQVDALVLARECHAAWDRFLRQRGLL